jgi:hypothetical protein
MEVTNNAKYIFFHCEYHKMAMSFATTLEKGISKKITTRHVLTKLAQTAQFLGCSFENINIAVSMLFAILLRIPLPNVGQINARSGRVDKDQLP